MEPDDNTLIIQSLNPNDETSIFTKATHFAALHLPTSNREFLRILHAAFGQSE